MKILATATLLVTVSGACAQVPYNPNYRGTHPYSRHFRPAPPEFIPEWQRAPFREPGHGPYPYGCFSPERGYVCGSPPDRRDFEIIRREDAERAREERRLQERIEREEQRRQGDYRR